MRFSRSCLFPTWQTIPVTSSPSFFRWATAEFTFFSFRELTTTLQPSTARRLAIENPMLCLNKLGKSFKYEVRINSFVLKRNLFCSFMLCYYYPSVDAVTIATLPSSFLATELILDVLEEAQMKKRRVKSPTVLNIIVVSQLTVWNFYQQLNDSAMFFSLQNGRGLFLLQQPMEKEIFQRHF